jgi:hypothetical protein
MRNDDNRTERAIKKKKRRKKTAQSEVISKLPEDSTTQGEVSC